MGHTLSIRTCRRDFAPYAAEALRVGCECERGERCWDESARLVLREAQVQHCGRKRERLANVLVASWVAEQSAAAFDESLLFLRATVAFTESYLHVLDKLKDAGPIGSVPFSEVKTWIVDASNRNEAAIIVLNDLCSQFAFAKRAWDLNQPDAKRLPLSTGNLSPEGIARKCFHAITDRGRRYVDYIIRGRTTDQP
jgi:hypothetical protein